MTSRSKLATALVIVAFIVFLLYSTLEVQRVECTVTVDFQGQRRTATASGASEESATERRKSEQHGGHRVDECRPRDRGTRRDRFHRRCRAHISAWRT